jgi:hypothetical protein
LIATASTAGGRRPPDIVLEGRFGAADVQRYSLVPFDLPPCHQIHVRYSYSDRIDSDPFVSGGNTLDIGLFDPRGTDTGSVGFRGWSGSHKDEFVVGEDWATPPYAAGPMPAGTWHVLLGPYKVGPRGLEWRVEIDVDPGLRSPKRDVVRSGAPARPALPPARDGWLRGDLHCHTRYSDGDSWPAEMLHAGAEAGLDFLGVTDHNNVAHHAEYGAGGDPFPIVVPGVEVTTYGGHWNAWGTDRWWEFRTPEDGAVEAAMADAVAAGAFVSVNHPKPFGPAWTYRSVSSFHAVEVWNGPWPRLNSEALSFWDGLLRGGRQVVAVGGSDTHILRSSDADPRHAAALGTPTTWVETGSTHGAGAILDALHGGRTFVSASPAGPQLYLTRGGAGVEIEVRDGGGCVLMVLDQNGVVDSLVVDSAAWSRSLGVARSSAYVRAQLVAHNGELRALTSAVR